MIWMLLVVVLAVAVVETGADDLTVEDLLDEYPAFEEEHSDLPDYNYDIYSEHVRSTPDLSNTTLRKCQCQGNQVWDGSTCIDHETYVALRLEHGHVVAANTSQFSDVTVKDIQCSQGQSKVLLDSNRNSKERFSILKSGNLYWFHQEFVNYCIDHTFDKNGKADSWQASVCLSPRVPQCCPPGYVVSPNGSCSYYGAYPIMPPVVVDDVIINLQAADEEAIANFTCEGGAKMYHHPLDSEKAQLLYNPFGVELRWMPPIKQHIRETRRDFCLGIEETDSGLPMQYVVRLCFKDPYIIYKEVCSNATCVRKCCKEFEFFYVDDCVPAQYEDELLTPIFSDQNDIAMEVSSPKNLAYIYGFPLCETFFQLQPHTSKDDEFYLLDNGQLYVPSFAMNFSAKEYCLDRSIGNDEIVRTLPMICFGSDEDTPCAVIQAYLYPILLLLSCVFLGITLLVYVSVPELHAKVHGKCLVSHVFALLTAYVSLVTVQWASTSLPMAACKFMASLIHVSFLAAFFWLNVMCFDIWWTLKSMRPVAESGEQSRFRFKIYSLYSWGCPILIAVVAAIIQALPESFENIIRPNFGYTRCWLDNDTSLWAYFYGFVLVLVVANILFFCQVAYILIMAQNDPIIQRTRQQNRERMWLYVKLFLVMGISWITEVISWQEQTCEFWIVTDIINALQGFSIFLIFICKRNMLKKIRSKWEPYLRQVKEVVGSSRPSLSATTNGREQSSFSSSVNRPNHSAASQRTVQSQVSIDSLSASRKLSAASLNSTTGAQVHSPHSFPMDTIQEANGPQTEPSVPSVISLDTIAEVQGEQGSQTATDFSHQDNDTADVNKDETMKKSQGNGTICSFPTEGGQYGMSNGGFNGLPEEEIKVPEVSSLSPDDIQLDDTLAKDSPRDSVNSQAQDTNMDPPVCTKPSDEVISYKIEVEGAPVESTSNDVSVPPDGNYVTNIEVLPNSHINQAFSIEDEDDEPIDV